MRLFSGSGTKSDIFWHKTYCLPCRWGGTGSQGSGDNKQDWGEIVIGSRVHKECGIFPRNRNDQGTVSY